MSDTHYFEYWLATSAISFTGTCTTTVSADGPTKDKYQAAASLTTRADGPQEPVSLIVNSGHADTKLSLGLTEDGRLTSSDLESTGEGPTLLGSAVSIVTSLATVAETAVKGEFVAPEGDDKGEGDKSGKKRPERKPFAGQHQLDQLTDGENKLTDYLVQLSNHIAGDANNAPDRPHPDDLLVVRDALKLVDEQRDRLTKEQVAWAAAQQTTSAISASYTIDIRDLPTCDDGHEFKPGPELSAAARTVWNELGLMMCLVDDHQPQVAVSDPRNDLDDGAPVQDGAETSIWYRRPRRVRLDLWKKKDGAEKEQESEEAELVQSSQVEIVDKHCQHIPLPLPNGNFWAHDHVSVKMGALGTPVSISDDRVPGLASAATELSKVPSQIASGISDASSISADWQKAFPAAPSAAAQQTATLKAQEERLRLQAGIKKLGGVPED
jgi:hypothetical protein